MRRLHGGRLAALLLLVLAAPWIAHFYARNERLGAVPETIAAGVTAHALVATGTADVSAYYPPEAFPRGLLYGVVRRPGGLYGIEPIASALTFAPFLVQYRGLPPETLRMRWTLFHTRGPQERHLCQLDYILLSPALAASNAKAVPDIVRNGQPWRTIFPPGQEVDRYPRTGWDRPKASDHCPVAVTLDLV